MDRVGAKPYDVTRICHQSVRLSGRALMLCLPKRWGGAPALSVVACLAAPFSRIDDVSGGCPCRLNSVGKGGPRRGKAATVGIRTRRGDKVDLARIHGEREAI